MFRVIVLFCGLICIYACQNPAQHIEPKVDQKPTKPRTGIDSICAVISKSDYKLSLNTIYSTDTLDIVDYREDKYSSPVILNQKLSFFKGDSLLFMYVLPIIQVERKVLLEKQLKALETPVYEMCLLKSRKGDFYYVVNGSDYCNGSDCSEFTGIYSMMGQKIFEGTSRGTDKISLNTILKDFELDINSRIKCVKSGLFK